MNDNIIDQVSHLANKDKMSRGLKILTHNNTTLYNSMLIAGVDNQANQDNEEDKNNQNNKSTNNEMDPDNIVG